MQKPDEKNLKPNETDLKLAQLFEKLAAKVRRIERLVEKASENATYQQVGQYDRAFDKHYAQINRLRKAICNNTPQIDAYKAAWHPAAFASHVLPYAFQKAIDMYTRKKLQRLGEETRIKPVEEYKRAALPEVRAAKYNCKAFAKYYARNMAARKLDVKKLLEEVSAGSPHTLFEATQKLTVNGDWHLLFKVVRDLHGNAEKATEPLDDAGRIRITARPAGGHVIIRVEDNGPGVPEKLLAQGAMRFGKTARMDPGITTGTGTGLKTGREIAERHGGTLEYAGAGIGGKGAAFELRLPQAKPRRKR
ncbi:MAG: ATP-binding protein [Candidatus Micrarchaeota archaeon]